MPIDPARIWDALPERDRATLERWQRKSRIPWHAEAGLLRYLAIMVAEDAVEREFARKPEPDYPEQVEQAARIAACARLGVTSKELRQWIRRTRGRASI